MADEKDDAKKDDSEVANPKGESAAKASAKGADEKPKPELPAKDETPAASKVSSPWPSSRKSAAPPAPAAEVTTNPRASISLSADRAWPKYAWGEKLALIDQKWTRLEARLVWWVLGAEVCALVFTVLIAGLATDPGGGAQSGIVLRSTLGALVFGFIAHRLRKGKPYHEITVTAVVILGAALGPQWSHAGTQYFGNLRNWMQNASILMFAGGVSQLAKRLTLWLALLGASVATAQGKHINLDVVMRFLKPRMRVPVAALGYLAAGLVSLGGVRAFFDEIAIADFRAVDEAPCAADPSKICDTSEASRASDVMKIVHRDFFLLGRQATLDLKAIPKIAAGVRYDDWFTGAEWNAWMKEGDWATYYPKADIDSLQMPDLEGKRSPAVVVPGAAENPQELMMRELDLIVPFGLFMIALRFLLRALLAVAGWVNVDPNAAHADDLGPNEDDREKREKKLEKEIEGGAS